MKPEGYALAFAGDYQTRAKSCLATHCRASSRIFSTKKLRDCLEIETKLDIVAKQDSHCATSIGAIVQSA